MIDQFVSGLPQPVPSAKAVSYDRQQPDAAGQDEGSETFGDVVSRAGQQQNNGGRNKNAKGQDAPDEIPANSGATARPALDLSVALRNLAGSADGRLKLANFKDALKTADAGTDRGESDDALLAKLMAKFKAEAKNATDIAGKAASERDALTSGELSPADELALLLGLTGAEETDGKQERKATSSRKDDTEKKDVAATGAAEHVSRSDGASADQMLAVGAVRSEQEPLADDDGKNDAAVRVVSADGRGRAVEINLAKVTSEQSKDVDKTNATSKIDTATVLEARRYLGFSQDTNAAVLANAAKADPGWSAALQAADRLDLSTLGNTVTEVNTLKLQMNPENLGSMVASLRLKGDELTVEIQVSTVEAYHHLSADQGDIVKALQDQGFTIDKVTVQLNAADRTDTGTDREMSRQGQQREEQGAQPDSGNRRDGNRASSRMEQEIRELASDDRTAGARRSGDIYL